MPVLEVLVQAKLDGVLVDGFPVIRRVEVVEAQSLNIQKANGDAGAYVALPTVDAIPTINVAILRSDSDVGFRLNGQTDKGIALKKGGLLCVIDATINDGATTNIRINNAGTTAASIRGIIGGT